jgi:acetyl-CoA synthetase
MQAQPSDSSGPVWWPDAETVAGANLTRFMRALEVDSFEALNERANRDPAWFHDVLIRFLDYRFERPYDRVLDLGDGVPFAHWCVGGVTNVADQLPRPWRRHERYGQPRWCGKAEDGA